MRASALLLSTYTWAFLIFMFAPLLLMVVASFNDVSPPSVTDWRATTDKWYAFFWMEEAVMRADPVLRAVIGPNGHPPVINAVGTVIIVLTVAAALAHTFLMRREVRS